MEVGHGILDYLIVPFLALYGFYAGLTKSHRVLYIIPATLSFYFFVRVGIEITPAKIVPYTFLLGALMARKEKYTKISKKNSWSKMVLFLFVIYLLIGLYYGSVIDFKGVYTPTSRMLIQFNAYISFILMYFIARKEVCNKERLVIFLKSFVWTTTILCIYAIYQIIADKYGLPYRGIVRTQNVSGTAYTGGASLGVNIMRINSFANEPKRLSYLLFISVIILWGYMRLVKLTFRQKSWVVGLIVLHFFLTLLTFSTSCYIAIVIFIPLMAIISITHKVHRYYIKYMSMGIIIVLMMLPFLYSKMEALYNERFTSQIVQAQSDYSARVETYAIKYIEMEPQEVAIGYGPGIYNFIIDAAFPETKGKAGLTSLGGLEPLNSAIITTLFDFGLAGMIVFFIWPILFMFLKFFKHKSKVSYQLGIPILLFLVCTSTVLNPIHVYFTFLGVFYGANH